MQHVYHFFPKSNHLWGSFLKLMLDAEFKIMFNCFGSYIVFDLWFIWLTGNFEHASTPCNFSIFVLGLCFQKTTEATFTYSFVCLRIFIGGFTASRYAILHHYIWFCCIWFRFFLVPKMSRTATLNQRYVANILPQILRDAQWRIGKMCRKSVPCMAADVSSVLATTFPAFATLTQEACTARKGC